MAQPQNKIHSAKQMAFREPQVINITCLNYFHLLALESQLLLTSCAKIQKSKPRERHFVNTGPLKGVVVVAVDHVNVSQPADRSECSCETCYGTLGNGGGGSCIKRFKHC